MKRAIIFSGLTFVGACAIAGEVNDTNVVTFQGGLPALASDVNANFDELIIQINDNHNRISDLEDAPSGGGGVVDLNVDCGSDPDALSAALANNVNATEINIDLSGTCEPVYINRSRVSIVGPAIITSDAGGANPITVDGANHVELVNLTLDAQGLAETALSVQWDASVIVTDVTASGASGQTLDVIRGSLRLSGNNSFTATGTPAAEVSGQSLVLVESGQTDFVSDTDVMLLNNSAVVANIAPSTMNISGTFMEINELSNLVVANGSVNVGSIQLNRAGVLNLDAAGSDVVTLTGNIQAINNSVINLQSQENASITTTGNFVLASNTVVQSAATGSSTIQFGVGAGNLASMNGGAQILVIGNTTYQFDNTFAQHGSLVRSLFGGNVASDSLFSISSSSIFAYDSGSTPISQNNVTCGFQGTPIAGFAYVSGGAFVNLCDPAP